MKLTSREAKELLESYRGKTESDIWIDHCIMENLTDML